jgi:phosphoadenosine phosphosulfate reductase
MLIDSPRITTADRQTWERLEHYDDALSRDPRLGDMEARAVAEIEAFAAAGPCHMSVSWGKDSVVVMRILAVSAAAETVPVLRARPDRLANPECDQVRDEFLRQYPHMAARYEEVPFTWRYPLRGEPGWAATQPAQDALHECLNSRHDGRYISGVRGSESTVRRISMFVHGPSTGRACRPIIRWRLENVFGYLAKHDLPVHPAYAMSLDGTLDRERLRVHDLGTEVGNRVWEYTYYRDVYQAAGIDPQVARADGKTASELGGRP